MSCKRASVSSKVSCYSSTNSKTSKTSRIIPKKVVPSKKLPSNSSHEGKSCSTGVITQNKKPEKHKKVTKSDISFKKQPKTTTIDPCEKCGDSSCNGKAKTSQNNNESDIETLVSMPRNVPNVIKKIPKSVQQYYKNKNFLPSTQSLTEAVNTGKRVSLATIKEISEIRSHESLLQMLDSEDEFDDSKDNLEDIKEFRKKNYFECHSAASRIKRKGNATSLQDHKCVYRFYLNDRLFPVPLCTDHNKEIRCIECLLPMNSKASTDESINGTIQAKVTLGKKNQDVMILLPIKEPLIINEKRRQSKIDEETLFFGLINLDSMGHSIFKPTLPGNSFALKYQKGFQELQDKGDYSYNDLEKDDVIVI